LGRKGRQEGRRNDEEEMEGKDFPFLVKIVANDSRDPRWGLRALCK